MQSSTPASMSLPKHVLIADDAEHVRTIVRALREDRGIFRIVDEASTGKEAVTLAAAWQPDAVVLNDSMPEMTGSEAAPLIRAVAPATRIVMNSSNDEAGADADARVDKVQGPAHLVAAVCRVLRVQQRAAERRHSGSTRHRRERRHGERRAIAI